MAASTKSSADDFRSAQRARIENEYPLLSFHYGLTYSDIVSMPRWLRRAYTRRLPELLAAEDMRRIEAAAFPNMKQATARSVIRRLERQAKVHEQQSIKGSPAVAASALGLGMTFVDRDGNPVDNEDDE